MIGVENSYKTSFKNIGFVSTRLAGTDGVSLETYKWADVLSRMGHSCFYLAGEILVPKKNIPPGKTQKDISLVVDSFHFKNEDIREIYEECFDNYTISDDITKRIESIAKEIKDKMHEFVDKFSIDILVSENAVTIPMNIPLGLALTSFINETGIHTIAHHHDFHWERRRFSENGIKDYLDTAFPPSSSTILHVVINSIAQKELNKRKGVQSEIIPNVMDFKNEPKFEMDDYSLGLREKLGMEDDELFVLQPTRIIPRKKIEYAIELVSRLGMKSSLVISHQIGDEEDNGYLKSLISEANKKGVRLIFAGDYIGCDRGETADGKRIYSLEDVYKNADLVTYTSDKEGFGNALIESIYYEKPIVINRFPIYLKDIAPKGFSFIELDNNHISESTINKVNELLQNPSLVEEITNKNYELGGKFFSYEVLEQKLKTLVSACSMLNSKENKKVEHFQ